HSRCARERSAEASPTNAAARARPPEAPRSIVNPAVSHVNSSATQSSHDSWYVHVARLDDHRYFSGWRAGYCGAGDEDAGCVRFHRLGIVNRLTIVAAQFDAEHFEQRRVLAVAGHHQHEIGVDRLVL